MNSKNLQSFRFQWQADQLVHALSQAGIAASTREYAREYASVITGLNVENFTVSVDEADYSKALQISRQLTYHVVDDEKIESPTETYTFRRFVTYNLMSFILPVIFNLRATMYYSKLIQQNIGGFKKVLATFVLIAGWIGGLVTLKYFFRII